MTLLKVNNVAKSFGAVQALKNISFDLNKGEILGLCGENGAGKSTIIKILSGVYPSGSYEGELLLDGNNIHFTNIADAEKSGVVVVHQELTLVPHMSVAENIFLGSEPNKFGFVNHALMLSKAKQLLNDLGINIDPATHIYKLGIGEQQLLEIAKALHKNARILILDEPTTALTEKEVEKLKNILRKHKDAGNSCIYISHKLNEVFDLCDRVSVLRDGATVFESEIKNIDPHTLIKHMVGREVKELFPELKQYATEILIKVKDLTLYDEELPDHKKIQNISFEVKAGEVLGIAGLMGAGRSEILHGIFGSWKGKVVGSVEIDDELLIAHTPKQAIEHGIAFVTEDRKNLGLHTSFSIKENTIISSLKKISRLNFVNEVSSILETKKQADQTRLKYSSIEQAVNTLSGGNQQKVVISKWLLTEPKVLLLDEPTRGIDVGARREIYELIAQLAANGMAIIMVSSELPEVIAMSHRILVLNHGRIAGEFVGKTVSQEKIMKAATV